MSATPRKAIDFAGVVVSVLPCFSGVFSSVSTI